MRYCFHCLAGFAIAPNDKGFVTMIAFLIDADNLSAPAWIEEACRTLEAAHGPLSIRRAYGSATHLKVLADVLRSRGIRPFVNLPLTKNTTDLALAVDAMELACQTPRPTVMVIGSGDADFLPLIVRLRERGIRMICVSERGKMAPEAVVAYDEILYVGTEQTPNASETSIAEIVLTKPGLTNSLAKKAAVKKPETKKPNVKSTPVKPSPTQKHAPKSVANTPAKVTIQQILNAAPALKAGQVQRLSEIAKLLHDAKLLAKNATSPKLFKMFPRYFELSPEKQPHQVRYLG